MSVQLPDKAKELLDGPTIVAMTTLRRDGSPQSTVVWAKRDGDDVLISTIIGRVKERNLTRDPRMSLTFFDPSEPTTSFSIDGSASMTTDGGPELIQELSRKYEGIPFTGDDGTDRVRVVVRVRPERVISHQ